MFLIRRSKSRVLNSNWQIFSFVWHLFDLKYQHLKERGPWFQIFILSCVQTSDHHFSLLYVFHLMYFLMKVLSHLGLGQSLIIIIVSSISGQSCWAAWYHNQPMALDGYRQQRVFRGHRRLCRREQDHSIPRRVGKLHRHRGEHHSHRLGDRVCGHIPQHLHPHCKFVCLCRRCATIWIGRYCLSNFWCHRKRGVRDHCWNAGEQHRSSCQPCW